MCALINVVFMLFLFSFSITDGTNQLGCVHNRSVQCNPQNTVKTHKFQYIIYATNCKHMKQILRIIRRLLKELVYWACSQNYLEITKPFNLCVLTCQLNRVHYEIHNALVIQMPHISLRFNFRKILIQLPSNQSSKVPL